ncbi:MAG: lipoate protein ligase C-terminal domain-containing protein [Candidatus Bathyarchaeia archaeon]
MLKAEYKVEGGKLIKVQLAKKGNTIDKIKITGDFFLHPEETIEKIEGSLVRRILNEAELANLIRTVIEKNEATLLGASPEDFAKCIIMASEKND